MTGPLPIILDVDTGTDDALALAYAVASPDIELVAVTTVAGNVNVEQATSNTLVVLDWLGAQEVPVHRGASRPLVRPHQDASHFHGQDGWETRNFRDQSAKLATTEVPLPSFGWHGSARDELTLVAVGPLTNLAIALNVEPRLPDLLPSVVIMGGAFHVPGNVTPAAEFNIYVDPEAAGQVFAATFPRLVAVGLDVTERVRLTRDDWNAAKGVTAFLLPVPC